MIRIGPQPLPPMRSPEQIVVDCVAAVRGGIDLNEANVKALIDWRHPGGNDRVCEALAILTHMYVDGAPKRKAPKPTPIYERRLHPKQVSDILDAIRDVRRATLAAGGVFTVEDIRPIIEKALG